MPYSFIPSLKGIMLSFRYRGPGPTASGCLELYNMMLNKTRLFSDLSWGTLLSKEPIKKAPQAMWHLWSFLILKEMSLNTSLFIFQY